MTMFMDFNYTKAIRQANEIDNVASDMLSIADKQMQTALDSIGVCWQGDASYQFIGYCTATQTDIRTQAKKLQDLARRIREVAKIIKDAEDKAKEIQGRQGTTPFSSGSGNGGGGGSGGRIW